MFVEVPLNDKVLIEVTPPSEEDGGVYIPEEIREETGLAKVLAVSPDLNLKRDLTGRMVRYKLGAAVMLSKEPGERKALIAYHYLSALMTE